MATDLEQLVVQMSADFRSFENAMAKATGLSRKQLAELKAQAANSGAAIETGFDGATRGITRFGLAAKGAQGNVRALQAQTGNLAAQFQDIGVQLAGGQSPFLIALQQGTQISQVFGGAGAKGAIAALGGAFASLVSPVSLVTVGLIAAGGAAVQYFAGLLSDGEKSEEDLKKQSELIQQVAKDWGDAIPAVKAYADEVARAQEIADLRESAGILQDRAYGDVRTQVEGLSQALVVLRSDLELLAGPEQVSAVSDLQNAFNDLEAKVGDNSATAADAERVQAALNAVMEVGAPTAANFSASMAALAGSLGAAADQAARAESQINSAVSAMQTFRAADAESMRNLKSQEDAGKRFEAEANRRNVLTKEQLDLEKEIANVKRDAADAGALVSPDAAERIAKENLAAEARRAAEARAARTSSSGGGGGGRSAAASEAERERKAVTDLIEQLQFEQSLIGATGVEKEKANALRRAGAAATAEEKTQIEGLVTAIYQQKEAFERSEEQMENLRAVAKDVLGGIFKDLRDGASAADILSNALSRVAENMVTAGIDSLIGAAFPATGGIGGGGGLLGGRIIPGILHSGGTAGRDGYGHGRSYPASLWANAPRFHGGGEVPALLLPGERVLNRRETAAYNRGSGRIQIDLGPDLEARFMDGAARQSVQISRSESNKVRRDVPRLTEQAQRRFS